MKYGTSEKKRYQQLLSYHNKKTGVAIKSSFYEVKTAKIETKETKVEFRRTNTNIRPSWYTRYNSFYNLYLWPFKAHVSICSFIFIFMILIKDKKIAFDSFSSTGARFFFILFFSLRSKK